MTLFQLNQLGDDWKGVIVSEGTLRPQDLINNLFKVLYQTNTNFAQDFYNTWEDIFTEDLSNVDSDDVNQMLTELFDAMDAIAPIGYAFESMDGDGACFGFVNQIEED
jgi:hypothetical protein